MRAGTLDRVVTITRPAEVLDEFGAPSVQPVAPIATLRARLAKIGVADAQGQGGTVTVTTAVVETRFAEGIAPGDRLALDGAEFDVTAVNPIDRRRGLEITATRRGP